MTEADPERFAGRLAPLGAVLFVLGIALGNWYGALIALLGTIALIFACRSREGFLLLGPFVRSELIRATRTRRLALWRFIYATAAAGMMFVCFADIVLSSRGMSSGLNFDQYTFRFFVLFSVVQFCYLTYLTISLIAPIVAEEREAKRWDFLLATDLRAREILIGKAIGRLPQILDPILAALPVLVLSTLFGGVSPRLVIAVSAATLAMLLGTTGIAFFFSVFAPTAKMATERTSGLLFAYIIFSGVFLVLLGLPQIWTFPTSAGSSFPLEVGDVVEFFGSGNPVTVVVMAYHKQRANVDTLEPLIEEGVRKFAAFHIGVFFLFGLRAMQRLRTAIPWKVAEKQKATAQKVDAPDRPSPPKPTFRPPIGEWPVFWLERYGQLSSAQMRYTAWYTPKKYGVFGVFAIGVLIGVRVIDPYFPKNEPIEITRVVLGFGIWVLTFMSLLPAAVRGARCVARERAADTLEGLLLTGLTPREILFQKWLGCVTADLPIFWIAITLSVAGTVTGIVFPLVPFVLMLTVPVYTSVAAAIGVYFSVRAKTPSAALRNMMLMSSASLFLLGTSLGVIPHGYGSIIAFPPAAIGVAFIPGLDPHKISFEHYLFSTVCIIISLGFYSSIGWLAWRAAVRRLESERHN